MLEPMLGCQAAERAMLTASTRAQPTCSPCACNACTYLQVRRRAVVPAFHKQYYEVMAKMFGDCTMRTVEKLEQATASSQVRALPRLIMQRRARHQPTSLGCEPLLLHAAKGGLQEVVCRGWQFYVPQLCLKCRGMPVPHFQGAQVSV